MLGRVAAFQGFGAVCARPGVLNSVNNRDGREHSDDPQHWRHDVEECADDHQHQTFWAFHKSHSTGANQRFSTRATVADHNGTDYYIRGQDDIKEASGACIENEQPKELGSVAVTIYYRVEKRAKAGDAILRPSYFAVHQIKETGADNDQASEKKHALLVLSCGVAEKKTCPGIYAKPNERKDIGMVARRTEQWTEG